VSTLSVSNNVGKRSNEGHWKIVGGLSSHNSRLLRDKASGDGGRALLKRFSLPRGCVRTVRRFPSHVIVRGVMENDRVKVDRIRHKVARVRVQPHHEPQGEYSVLLTPYSLPSGREYKSRITITSNYDNGIKNIDGAHPRCPCQRDQRFSKRWSTGGWTNFHAAGSGVAQG